MVGKQPSINVSCYYTDNLLLFLLFQTFTLSSGSVILTLNWDLDVFGHDLAGLLPGVNLNEGF